jgi:RNA polymerase sigma factor (sigma-70 family)
VGHTIVRTNRPQNPDTEQSEETLSGPPGDRVEVVRRLFQDHNRALIRFLTARLHCEQEARDVAQEAYVRLLQLEHPGALGFLRAYLFKIAANLAIDRVRMRSVRAQASEKMLFEEIEESLAPEHELVAEQELDSIARRLSALPERCRYAFVMHVLLEQPIKDIAATLGLTERMVRNYVVRGLIQCRGSRNSRGDET